MIEADVLRHVTRLIAADGKRSTPVDRLTSMVKSVQQPTRPVMQDVLQAPRDPVRVALDGVSDHTLVHIMALILYGQADENAQPMVHSFEDAQAAARQRYQSSGRARVVRYVQSRPLSRYLLAGIARMQRDFEARGPQRQRDFEARQPQRQRDFDARQPQRDAEARQPQPSPLASKPGERNRDQDG